MRVQRARVFVADEETAARLHTKARQTKQPLTL